MDLHFAVLNSTISNMSGKWLKKDVVPKDFLVDFWARPTKSEPVTKQQQIEDLRQQMRTLGLVQSARERQGGS